MSEQTNTYRDNSFNPDQAYYYTLLLQVNAASFSYAVLNDNKLVAWAANCALNELSEPQQLAEILSANYKNIVLGLPANDLTLVPTSLYGTDKVADYARFLNIKADERVLAQQLDDQNFIVYKTDEKVIAAVQKYDLKRSVYTAKGWIRANAQNNTSNNDIYLNTENNRAEFLSFINGSLRFYNAFEFNSPNDLVYFAAFVAEELDIYARNARLIISGSIQYEDDYYNRLADFFPGIAFNDQQLIELPAELKPERLLTLAALSLCVSSEVY